jgi:hypothetical protein
MTTTLANMTLILAETIAKVIHGSATAVGTTTTLKDTANLTQPNSMFDKGSLWLLSGTYIGTTRQISAFSENQLTWTTAYGGNIASGTLFAVVDPDFPYVEFVKAINNALEEIGPVLATDITTAVDATKCIYTLPTGVSLVKRVRVFDTTDDTTGYDSNHWSEEAGKLVFDPGWQPTTTGWYLKLYYATPHPYIAADADVVNWGVDIERLKWVSAVHLLRWGMRQYGDDERKIPQFLQDAMQRADALVRRVNKGFPQVMVHAAR